LHDGLNNPNANEADAPEAILDQQQAHMANGKH